MSDNPMIPDMHQDLIDVDSIVEGGEEEYHL